MKDWKKEFDEKFGKAYISDDSGGHFIGSYLIEFIESLLTQVTQKVQEEAKREERKRIKSVENRMNIANIIQSNYHGFRENAESCAQQITNTIFDSLAPQKGDKA